MGHPQGPAQSGLLHGLAPIGFVDYTRSKKRVHGFAGAAPPDAAPHCASWEVDKAEFIELSRARRIIHPDQAAFLDRLLQHLGGGTAAPDDAASDHGSPHVAGEE